MIITKLDRFILGAELIKKYDPDPAMDINSSFVHLGGLDVCSEMSESEYSQMKEWGWVHGYYAWGFHITNEGE
jgi:hypothetical protein